MVTVITISNLKGGVGKSVTAASLAIGLARSGLKVLAIDADAQYSLTVSLGIRDAETLPVTLAIVIGHTVSDTPEENMFYLVIDRQRDTENVYLLNAVTEDDLMGLVEKTVPFPV